MKVIPEYHRYQWVAMTRAAIEGRSDDTRKLMAQCGFFPEDAPISAEELQRWWGELLPEITATAQPATYTPQNTGRLIRGMFDPRGNNPLTRMAMPEHFVFTARVQLALSSVNAALQATVPARAIADDIDGISSPITDLGKLHHTWVRDRGLPTGLDRHDHP